MGKIINTFAIILLLILFVAGIALSSIILNNTHPQKQQLSTSKPPTNLLNGQWSSMPGVRHEAKKLRIVPSNNVIVNQDGSIAEDNPAINIAGTRIGNLEGDFVIDMTIDLHTSKAAYVAFYDQLPIIMDEFMIQQNAIQLTIKNGSLAVSVQEAKGKESKFDKVFHFTPRKSLFLTMKREGDTLTFIINNKKAGSIEANVFMSKQLFFGLVSRQGEWKISAFTIAPLSNGTFTVMHNSHINVPAVDEEGLQNLASQKRPNFIVGMARALYPSFTDQQYQKIAFDKNIFGSLTPENAMKMINLQPQRGVYTFEYADALVKEAQEKDITVHGHTLVFGEANPPWFNDLPTRTVLAKQQIEQIMLEHITNVVGHFKGKVASWDVINEPLADYDDTPDGEGATLREHAWYKAMGEEYIIKALEAAHRADPNAMLFINEYGLEQDGKRWNAFIGLMRRVKAQLTAKKIPANSVGVGFQTHIYTPEDRIDPRVLKQHIKEMEELGFKVQISEMDVYGQIDGADKSEEQAEQYREVFKVCFEEKNCIAWRGWILSDRYNFWHDGKEVQQGVDGLFDTDMRPRPAYKAIQEHLKFL